MATEGVAERRPPSRVEIEAQMAAIEAQMVERKKADAALLEHQRWLIKHRRVLKPPRRFLYFWARCPYDNHGLTRACVRVEGPKYAFYSCPHCGYDYVAELRERHRIGRADYD